MRKLINPFLVLLTTSTLMSCASSGSGCYDFGEVEYNNDCKSVVHESADSKIIFISTITNP